MYNQEFWLKYTFRLLHIAPVIALGGKIIYDYLFPCNQELTKPQIYFAAIAGVLLMVAGIVNMFLLKPKEKLKNKSKLWIGSIHLKTMTSVILLTPLIKLLIKDNETSRAVQFYYVVAMIIVSPFLRFYREGWTEFNRMNRDVPEHILQSYKIPYSLQDTCLNEYATYLICMRHNPRILENAVVHALPFAGAISNCGRLKDTFNKCQEYRERELFEDLRKMYVESVRRGEKH